MNLQKIEEILFKIGKYLLIIDTPTRNKITSEAKHYLSIIIFVILVEMVLIFFGVILPWRIVPGILFTLAIFLFLLTYIPMGVARNFAISRNIEMFLWRSTTYKGIYTSGIRKIAGWLAFAGWLGIIHNHWLNHWTVLVGIFLFFIFDAFGSKRPDQESKFNPLVICFVVILTGMAIWESESPIFYEASTDLYQSLVKRVVSMENRQTGKNRAEAAATYGRLNRDIYAVYTARFVSNNADSAIKKLDVQKISVKTNTLVKVFHYGKEVKNYEDQGFIEIQFEDVPNSFVDGEKFWVEADYLDILSPGDLAEERRLVAEKENKKSTSPVLTQVSSRQYLSGLPYYDRVGSYDLGLQKGQVSAWITVGPCHRYNFSSDRITLKYKNRDSVNVWEIANLPNVATFKVINRGEDVPKLLVKS
jgi:hypothetical protein